MYGAQKGVRGGAWGRCGGVLGTKGTEAGGLEQQGARSGQVVLGDSRDSGYVPEVPGVRNPAVARCADRTGQS